LEEKIKFIVGPCEECGQKFRVPLKNNITFIICPRCKKRYPVEKGLVERIEKDPGPFTIEEN
tara:strand:- start:134 stop:319 length:186 start_codon:yes stop_codon:yes gene_type:complete